MNDTTEKPMHVLYLIDELKVKGGTEKHLFELSAGMADAGWRVTVFSLSEGEYAGEFRKHRKVRYYCLNAARINDLKGIASIFRLVGYIRKERVNIIQSFHTASDLIGPVAARLSLRPVRVLSSRRDEGYTKSGRHIAMQKYINRFVDNILANSTAVKKAVVDQEGYPPERIEIIYNGIDISHFKLGPESRAEQRRVLGAGPDSFLIGSVGNIRPIKGYDLLVEAAGIVCRRLPDVSFYHVGKGPDKARLQERCRELEIDNRFCFLGFVRDVPLFLCGLDIYVQPSLSEGFSNSILEAMAVGVPVVATAAGGNSDLIKTGENGFLVPIDDPESLAESMISLVKNVEQRVSFAERAYDQLQNKYQMSSMLANYIEYYQTGTVRMPTERK